MTIRLQQIHKTYKGVPVLQDFSADFAEPGVSCLMGPSGVGKTTLLRIMLGLTAIDSGLIHGIAGRKIAAVFQEDRLLPWCSAIENVALVLDGTSAREQATKVLRQVELAPEAWSLTATELSGGMQRRVAIARALAVQPEILVLDEPFKGLDATLKYSIMALIRNFSRKKTVILVTHDAAEADFFGAKVVTMLPTHNNLNR